MNAKLRVALLLDSLSLPAWMFTALKRLVRSNDAELVLVVLNQLQPGTYSLGRNLLQNPRHWLYHIFNVIDESLFIHGSNALSKVDATEILSGVAQLVVKPVGPHGKQQFNTVDIEAIQTYQPDILVKLGFGKLTGDVLSVASHGTWAYRWGDANKIEDGLTGFWEVARGWPETGASLQQLGDHNEPGGTLAESWFFTYPYSPARNRNYVLWAAASFLSRQVTRLHQLGGKKWLQEVDQRANNKPGKLLPNNIPSNSEVLGIMIKLISKNLLEVFRRTFRPDRWELLFNTGSDAERDLSSFKRISPPAGRFWADPHIVYKDPNYYIFIEEYLYRTRRAHIAVIEMDQKGNYKQTIPVLKENYHLSFPFVFDWMGQYYMIPESSENKTIDLYECIAFPHHWQHKLTLMKDVSAVDTVIVNAQGKWWLFTAMAEQQAAAPQVELFLFYSNELFTDQWTPHPMNPIVSDVKKARGAGGIVIKGGRLFRPSQYGSSSYGHGFDVNEIVSLSETEYCERTVTTVRPEANLGIIATHTYANQGNLTIVDALMHRPKWAKAT